MIICNSSMMGTRFRCNHVFICVHTTWFHSPVTHARERAAYSSAILPLVSQQSRKGPSILALRFPTALCSIVLPRYMWTPTELQPAKKMKASIFTWISISILGWIPRHLCKCRLSLQQPGSITQFQGLFLVILCQYGINNKLKLLKESLKGFRITQWK